MSDSTAFEPLFSHGRELIICETSPVVLRVLQQMIINPLVLQRTKRIPLKLCHRAFSNANALNVARNYRL